MLAQYFQKLCQIKFRRLDVLRQSCHINDQGIMVKKTRTFSQLLAQSCRDSIYLSRFEQQGNQWQISAFDVVTLRKRSV